MAQAHLRAVQRLPGVTQTREPTEAAGAMIRLVVALEVVALPLERVVAEVARVAVHQAQVVVAEPGQVVAEVADGTNL